MIEGSLPLRDREPLAEPGRDEWCYRAARGTVRVQTGKKASKHTEVWPSGGGVRHMRMRDELAEECCMPGLGGPSCPLKREGSTLCTAVKGEEGWIAGDCAPMDMALLWLCITAKGSWMSTSPRTRQSVDKSPL